MFELKILSIFELVPTPRNKPYEKMFFNALRMLYKLLTCHVEEPKLETTKMIAITNNMAVINRMICKKILGIVHQTSIIIVPFLWPSHASILRACSG